MENFGKFMAFVFFTLIGTVIQGFVFSKLWLWFIVSTFQMQPIRIIESVGILLLIGFIRAKRKDVTNEDFWGIFILDLVFLVLISVTVLIFGWIFKLFL